MNTNLTKQEAKEVLRYLKYGKGIDDNLWQKATEACLLSPGNKFFRSFLEEIVTMKNPSEIWTCWTELGSIDIEQFRGTKTKALEYWRINHKKTTEPLHIGKLILEQVDGKWIDR
jgi:hypothetical protein